jgi:predicted 3-demethylubiquinone-9 3-methyltransferase (glyoxalase superfamily)
MPKITPFLWFDTQAEQAAKFYTSLFPNSEILSQTRYGKGGPGPEGSVMTVTLTLDGQKVTILNGGPHYKLTEAFSWSVECADQEEVDRYWNALTEGGQEGPCGWLRDRFGLSWQIVPAALIQMLSGPDPEKSNRAMQAMLKMKKLDIATLRHAYERNTD